MERPKEKIEENLSADENKIEELKKLLSWAEDRFIVIAKTPIQFWNVTVKKAKIEKSGGKE
jgi:hypothetical protein